VFIPGDGDLSHPSVKTRMSKILQPMLPSSSKSEETVLSLQADGTTILNQDEGMTVMISGSVQDAEGEIEIQPEEVIIEQDQGSEIQILGLPETADGQTSMVLLQLDNSGMLLSHFFWFTVFRLNKQLTGLFDCRELRHSVSNACI